ncbi:hypothetical protein OG339_15405 [Streptosporangium sp. NBC_01495]|uniref:hypothetical protein n=1 Tax=Streptosporangium sp. NBC_01495 TaxID=2903899 RepID=UPI002E33E88D|nr:hypothetical protein [Streptosporangium sp. NBC_01495]
MPPTVPSAGLTARRPAFVMPPPLRKAVLTLHVAISVGWLGLDLGLLSLGTTALTTGDPELLRASYLAMDVFGDTLIVPVSLGALLTGVLLCLGTPWGLVRYHWVLIKLVTTLAATTASILALRSHIGTAAAAVSKVPPAELLSLDLGGVDRVLVIAPSVALALYLLNVVLSVFKPFGRTPYGRRRPAGPRRAAATPPAP